MDNYDFKHIFIEFFEKFYIDSPNLHQLVILIICFDIIHVLYFFFFFLMFRIVFLHLIFLLS